MPSKTLAFGWRSKVVQIVSRLKESLNGDVSAAWISSYIKYFQSGVDHRLYQPAMHGTILTFIFHIISLFIIHVLSFARMFSKFN